MGECRAPHSSCWFPCVAGQLLALASACLLVGACQGDTQSDRATRANEQAAETSGTSVSPPRCAPTEVSCAGLCAQLVSDPHNCGICGATCAAGARCVSGSCTVPGADWSADSELTRPRRFVRCPVGFSDCGSGCIDLRIDTANCGTCGNVCSRSGTCSFGHCS